MAYTALSDVVTPEVFDDYQLLRTAERWPLVRAGIVQIVPKFAEFLEGGGDTFKTPFWNSIVDTTGDPQVINSGTVLTLAKQTTGQFNVRRFIFGQGWSNEDLAGALAGDNPAEAVAEEVGDYWEKFLNKVAITQVQGAIADNIVGDSSDLIHDVSVDAEADINDDTLIGRDGIVDTQFKMEDRQDKFNGGAIALHSDVYKRLVKEQAIDFSPENEQNIGFGAYGNMSVVIDNNLPKTAISTGTGYKYWSIIYQKGAFGFNEGGYGAINSGKIVMSETDRTAASGQNQLFNRRQFIMAPRGIGWTEGDVAGDNPTLAEMASADNWDRKFKKKDIGFTVLITNG